MKKTLLFVVMSLILGVANAQVDCNIANMQGSYAGGYLNWVPGQDALYVLIDPADDYGIAQSCGASYPYTIQTVDFDLADGTAFGVGTGTGTFEYVVNIYGISGGDPCNGPGSLLGTSGVVTANLTGTSLTPQSITFDLEVNDAFFVSYEPISWTGLASEVPSILWDDVARPYCVQQMTTDGGATFLDFTDFFTGGETGWAAFTVFGSSSTGTGNECDAGTITDTTPVLLCPGESVDFDTNNSQVVPPGNTYCIYFVPTTGTGALEGAFYLTGVTTPYTIDYDLGGLLSGGGYPVFEGEWQLYSAVVTDANDPANTVCAQSTEFVPINFLTASDPLCEDVGNEACLDWVSPSPTTGWVDFVNIFGLAPCDDGTGCAFNEIDLFEVYQGEAYRMDGVQSGASYTFSHCNGPGAGSWVPNYTIIAPSGAVDAFGAGDGDGCSITWTASEDGTYLVVINEAGYCGLSGSSSNGYPAITCNGATPCIDDNYSCEYAVPVSEGQHTYADIYGGGANDGCGNLGLGSRWFTYTPSADGTVTVKSCGGIDTYLSIYTGDCTNLTCLASNDDDGDTNCEPTGAASSVVDLDVTAGVTYYIEWSDDYSNAGSDWEITFSPPPVCEEPVATAALDLSACPTEEFSVNVNLTSLGNATTVDIVENIDGGGVVVIHGDVSVLQNYVMGPYTMGSDVLISVYHNDDAACNVDLGSFTAEGCPPVNDLCADALPIECGNDVTGTNEFATPYNEVCVGDSTAAGVWYTFVGANSSDPGAVDGTPGDQVTLSTCSTADYDTKIDVFSGACGTLTCVGGNDDGNGCDGFTSLATIPTVVGETYYVLVSGYSASSVGTFTLSMSCEAACLPVPANDECADAEMLTIAASGAGTATEGTNECASNALESPSCEFFGTVQDVWYTFSTGAVDTILAMNIEAITMDGAEMGIVVYADSCGGTEVLCETGTDGEFLLDLEPNQDYFIQVYSDGPTGEGSFNITLEQAPDAPANDLCAGAIELTCGDSVTGATTFATNNDAPALCDTDLSTAPGVWYTLEGVNGTMTASLCGSPYDSKIGVFSGSCGTLTCVVGGDDDIICADGNAEVSWASDASETYYIYVTGFSTEVGEFSLAVSCEETSDEPCLDWVNPSPNTGWIDFTDIHGGAPCDDGTGCPFLEIDVFEVYQSEAYQMINAIQGGTYTFSHCNGPNAGSWIPEYTIIAPSGAVDAYGSGNGDGCSITWTASEAGNYLIVINEAGSCGIAAESPNGYPALTCSGNTMCPDAPANDDCVNATDIAPGEYDFNTYFASTDGPEHPGSDCDNFGEAGLSNDLWYTYTASCDGVAVMTTCGTTTLDTRLAVYPGGACPTDGSTLIACNDDGDDENGDPCANFTSVLEWEVTEGETYLLRLGGYDATSSGMGTFELIEDCYTSIDESNAEFAVFPNPNSGQFVIDYAGEAGKAQIQVLDVSGKTVYDAERSLTNGSRLDIDLGNVDGMYFVRITMDQNTTVLKVVVQ